MTLRLLIAASLLIVMAGCSSKERKPGLTDGENYLDPALGVMIFTPENAWNDDKEQIKSGNLAASIIRKTFAKHAKKSVIARSCIADGCLERFNSQKYGYYVKSQILHWEENTNEWPSERDRVEINITVYNAATNEALATTSYKAASPWPAIALPRTEKLLLEPTAEFVATLYEKELEEPVKVQKPSRFI